MCDLNEQELGGTTLDVEATQGPELSGFDVHRDEIRERHGEVRESSADAADGLSEF